MERKIFYSTNNRNETADFETALMRGMAPDYGLYMVAKEDVPTLSVGEIDSMRGKSYAHIAYDVLAPYLEAEIGACDLMAIVEDAYRPDTMPTDVSHVCGGMHILWLTQGPTYSFKDYAARFLGRSLDHFLGRRGERRTVLVATSGDTGGAVADALYGLANVDCVVFYPRGSVSEPQRRQMTTLQGNVHALEVNGDFDVCQALAKSLLGDHEFAVSVFGDRDRFTSANSISLGRLLPQAVFPFFAYSRIAQSGERMIVSIPCGNFGDMMGTVIARQMGLPIERIICGVNENREFPDFLYSGTYEVRPSVRCPSSAMVVSHPSNLARLIDFYGGHMHDERDATTKRVVRPGVIDRMPDMEAMRADLYSVSVDNEQHYRTMRYVHSKHGVVLDPHGAVGWRALERYCGGDLSRLSVVYETADPGKFPDDVKHAIGILPELPPNMENQAGLPERKYIVDKGPEINSLGQVLSSSQISQAKDIIAGIYG